MGPEDTYSNHNHHRAQPPPAATIYGDSRRPYQQPRGGDEDRSYYSNRSHSQNGDGGRNRGYPTDAYHQSRRDDNGGSFSRDRNRDANSNGRDSYYSRPSSRHSRERGDRGGQNEGRGRLEGRGSRWDHPDRPDREEERGRDQMRYQRTDDGYDGPRRSRHRSFDYGSEEFDPDIPPPRWRENNPRFDSRPPPRGPNNGDRPRTHDPVPVPLLPKADGSEWPPCFDKDGSSFVFHPASGMFYEELSDFFYDPKSKLYYGVKKAAYFRFDDTQDPPFVETQKADTSQGTPAAPVEQAITLPSGGQLATNDATQKPLITINLKTKKIKKPKALTNKAIGEAHPSPAAPLPTKAQAEQAAYIEKWQEKQAELKAIDSDTNGIGSSVVRRTVKGEPVCIACKRKFPSIEKLRLHEAKSELHRLNMEKLAAADHATATAKKEETLQPGYHDRAEKRRKLHALGGSAEAVVANMVSAGQADQEPAESEKLNEDHIGNKLLQKMGWEAGSNLGKKVGESTQTTAADNIRRDWDRIEAMTGSGSR